ncbi:hypothetical protein [Lewinella sp. IMCC34183]|uniref:hypothetical protein n=1 Tax=Lewinella sp. IMCC34183 TaxID=2248762 RepID=UPI00130037BA|nr:hypothetical protein [Lewinella sp. IMCC34183]
MNPDKLEQYLRDHREEFDGDTPPDALWDRIESTLPDTEADDADPLAEFIVKHREAFDTATPPPRLAHELLGPARGTVKPLRRSRRRILGYLMGVAATFLLLFVAYTSGNRAGFRAGREEQAIAQLERMNPELAEAERFYRQRIASELTKVTQVNDDPQLRRDLAKIDDATREIRSELLKVPASQRHVLVNQLISTYRTKLDILLRIQQHFPNPNPTGTGQVPANSDDNEI